MSLSADMLHPKRTKLHIQDTLGKGIMMFLCDLPLFNASFETENNASHFCYTIVCLDAVKIINISPLTNYYSKE